MAGNSARELARRQREKAERLQRSAARWERGAQGEEATAAALAQLPTETWTIFHDVRWPGRRYANVDHIVVGPPGVFVIDSKNWSGRVAVKDGVLRQGGRSRAKSVAAAAEAGVAVAGLVPQLKSDLVHPVLCFVSDDELSGWSQDVMVCSTTNVVEMLLSRPRALSDDEARLVTLDVDAGLSDAGSQAVVAAKPRSRVRSRRRRSGWSDGIKALIALGAAWILLTQPAILHGVSDTLAGWFTDGVSHEQDSPAEPIDAQPAKKKQGKDEKRQP